MVTLKVVLVKKKNKKGRKYLGPVGCAVVAEMRGHKNFSKFITLLGNLKTDKSTTLPFHTYSKK